MATVLRLRKPTLETDTSPPSQENLGDCGPGSATLAHHLPGGLSGRQRRYKDCIRKSLVIPAAHGRGRECLPLTWSLRKRRFQETYPTSLMWVLWNLGVMGPGIWLFWSKKKNLNRRDWLRLAAEEREDPLPWEQAPLLPTAKASLGWSEKRSCGQQPPGFFL